MDRRVGVEDRMVRLAAMPRIDEIVPVRDAQPALARLFPSWGSLEWELRVHRAEYVAAGALFEIGGRLLVHQPTLERVALDIGSRRVAARQPRAART